jgi:hypothetical protein
VGVVVFSGRGERVTGVVRGHFIGVPNQ